MIDPQVLLLIENLATQYQVDSSLIKAICEVESAWEPFRTRYEPKWSYLYYPDTYAARLLVSLETEIVQQSTSWGLMQTMGSLCREQGYDDYLTKLPDPKLCLLYGIKHLAKLKTRYCAQDDVIASYNAGSVRMKDDHHYVNQDYVDKVNLALSKYNT